MAFIKGAFVKKDWNKYKFVLLVTGIFLIPFLILSSHFIRINKNASEKNYFERMALRTKAVSNAASDILNADYNVFRKIKKAKFQNFSISKMKKFLKKQIAGDKGVYRGFAVFDSRSKKLFSVGDIFPNKDMAEAALKNLVSMGAVKFSKDEPISLMVAEPILNSSKRARFVVLGKINLTKLADVVRSYGKNNRGEIGILDAGGQIICDSAGKAIIKPGISVSEYVVATVNASVKYGLKNFHSKKGAKNDKSLIAVANISGSEWWVYETVKSSQIATYEKWAKKVVWSGILVIIVFGFFTLKFAELLLIKKSI